MDKQQLMAELEAKKDTLEGTVEKIKETLVAFETQLSAITTVVDMYQKGSLQLSPEREPKELRKRAYDFLKAFGQPLHYVKMAEVLMALGVEVGGQNPAGNLTAHMSQDSRFRSFGEGKWGLSEWDIRNLAPTEPTAQSNARKNGALTHEITSAELDEAAAVIRKVNAVGAHLHLNEQGLLDCREKARLTPELLKEIGDHRETILTILNNASPMKEK